MSGAAMIAREILESRDAFCVMGALELDVVSSTEVIATLIGHYEIPAVKLRGAGRPFIGCVPWFPPFHEQFTQAFDADHAIQRTGVQGPGEVRGSLVLLALRATVFTEQFGLNADTPLAGLKVSTTIPIDTGLPDQRFTFVIDRCITNPAVRRVGQLVELSKPSNRPDRFGQRLKTALGGFKATFGEAAWRDVLSRLQAAYGGPARDKKLLEPRDDGWDERQRFRDLAKIEEASLSYLREVSADIAAQLVRGQQEASRQAETVKKTAQASALRQVRSVQ